MEIVALAVAFVGFVFLFFGRHLFWLFAALSGFLLGTLIGSWIGVANNMGSAGILIGLIAGGLFAVLSIYLQKPMAALSGFVLGGTIVAFLYIIIASAGDMLALMYGASSDLFSAAPVVFLLGGILSAVFIWVAFEWALIILSSIFGSLLAATGLLVFFSATSPMAFVFSPGPVVVLLPLLLAALAVFVQSRLMAKPTVVVAPLPPSAPNP